MATDKTFTVVGVSKQNGVFKVRYANSVKRAAVVAKNGHSDIVLIELDDDREKVDCVDALLGAIDDGLEMTDEAKAAVFAEAREFGFIL